MRVFASSGPMPVTSAVCERLHWSARQAMADQCLAEARAHLQSAVGIDGSPRSSIALARFEAEHASDHRAALRALLQAWRTSQTAGQTRWIEVSCRLLEAGYRQQADLLSSRQFEQLAISAWCETLAVDTTSRPVSLEILRDAAALAALWGSWNVAAVWLDEGLQNADLAERAEWEVNFGAACLKLKRWQAGRRHLLHGFIASKREGDADGCGHALMTLGSGYSARQMWSRAETAYRAAARWFAQASRPDEAGRCLSYAREAARFRALESADPSLN